LAKAEPGTTNSAGKGRSQTALIDVFFRQKDAAVQRLSKRAGELSGIRLTADENAAR